MATSDTLQRFIFDNAPIRGEMVHLEKSYQTIVNQRVYPTVVKRLLSEASVAGALLIDTIKFNGDLSLQFQSDSEDFSLLLVQYNQRLQARGFAQCKQDLEDRIYEQAFLSGRLVINLNSIQPKQHYQSIVPLDSLSIATNLMHYFAQSEQLATHIRLTVGEHQAAGMLLQLMPNQNTQQKEQFWEYAVQVGQTVTDQELLNLNNETILHRLYHETPVRLFDAQYIQFACRCNKDKMQQAVKMLGKEEALELIAGRKVIEVTCEFCNDCYAFDAIDVAMLFQP